MAISRKIHSFISQASWIRRMFEEGVRLRQIHGAENVYDFSLGNPDVEPPAVFKEELRRLAGQEIRGMHAYMPNAGYPDTRRAVAEYLSGVHGVSLTADHLIMTSGAGGALNVILKSLLDPGDEVLTPAPFFVEYRFYADNAGGVLKTVPTRRDFSLDLDALAAAVGEKTKVVLVNSPNNPTGQVYPAEDIAALAAALTELSRGRESPIFLVADEPYRFLTYDGCAVPPVLPASPYSLVVSSFSKNLSLAGERVGFVAVSPDMPEREKLVAGMVFANRIMGFVNAPAIGQAVVLGALDAQVDTSVYTRRRDAMAGVLSRTGYEFFMPRGAFYFFPKSPIPDEVAFVSKLAEHRVLAVPGRGFGMQGYFRLAFCVDEAIIARAEEGLRLARDAF